MTRQGKGTSLGLFVCCKGIPVRVKAVLKGMISCHNYATTIYIMPLECRAKLNGT